MKFSFSKINVTNADLNYDVLKESIIEKLGETCKEAEVIILNNFPVSISSHVSLITYLVHTRLVRREF